MNSKICFLITLMVCATGLMAQSVEVRKKQFNIEESGLALQGYDPVVYFVNNKAAKGKPEISILVEGVIYRFTSEKNKNTFLTNPSKYEPQYGGWCAYAMGSNGNKIEIDPETFKITDGKLYLFYNKFFTNTLKEWNKNEVPLKTTADKNWEIFIHHKP
ncbi:MAG: YHS domain protein [Bacteroidetes bacterium]|nr:YHS domain protein [Bacteroidota bacterium]MBS1981212.1 YHS domain protein [Bacteroidota bacterium]